MKVFGLVAFGPLVGFEGEGSIHSRLLYRSGEQAERAKPEFEKLCKSDNPKPTDLAYVMRMHVLEYELVDDPSK